MRGVRREILGAPGGRTRYPITIRRIKLEAPMDTRAMVKIKGVIVNNNSFSSPDSRAPPKSESSLTEGFRANQTGKEHQVYFGLQNSIGFVRE
jgi:hypothetical protein